MTYELFVDGRTHYVTALDEHEMRKAMFEHIRTERAKGRELASIEFVYHPITLVPLAHYRSDVR